MATIVLQRELEEATYQCRTALRKANEAIRELYRLADYPTPTTLADVTTQSLIAFVSQRQEAVNNTPLYTAKERERIISEWQEWRVKTMPLVVAVEQFVTEWQDVSPGLDTATMSILTSDITESLAPRFTVEIPLQAHRHKELINAVRVAYNDLREWEHEQDCKKVPLKNLLSLTDEDINQSWASGNIKVDHSEDTPRLCAWRNAQDAAIL